MFYSWCKIIQFDNPQLYIAIKQYNYISFTFKIEILLNWVSLNYLPQMKYNYEAIVFAPNTCIMKVN